MMAVMATQTVGLRLTGGTAKLLSDRFAVGRRGDDAYLDVYPSLSWAF
jgi:hypothetical protein